MHYGSCLHALFGQILLAVLLRPKYFLEDESSALLACADLINKNLGTDVLELVTGTCWTSSTTIGASLFLLLPLREVAQDFFSVFIYAIKEQVLDFNLV